MKIIEKEILETVYNAFEKATNDVGNGETPVDMKIDIDGDSVDISFSIDCGRGGTDSYNTSCVSFDKGKVYCRVGESLEGSGVEEEVEENLKDFANYLKDCEIIKQTNTISISHDTSPTDMLGIITSLLENLNINYVIDGEETLAIKYEIPLNYK